jgi:hypothetical protein
MTKDDVTVVYYTANVLSEPFVSNTKKKLLEAIGGLPLISVSKKPMDFGQNICVGDTPRNHIWTYRQALIGAKAAKTKYIALAEDDIFYSSEHFTRHTPTPDTFAYNGNVWSLFTWGTPIFSWRSRRALHSLLCERGLFIDTIDELFTKYPNDDEFPVHRLGEPGRYEHRQGTTPRKTEMFPANVPNIAVSHPEAIGFEGLGMRKKHAGLRETTLPYWGSAEEVLKLCQI